MMPTKHRNKWVTLFIRSEWSGYTIERFLKENMLISNRMLNRLTRMKGIRYQGKTPFLQQKVKPDTYLEVALRPLEKSELLAQEVPFEIVYEELDFLVVNKPAGIKVHPTSPSDQKTLAHGIVYYQSQRGEEGIVRPVHRLDQDTSGLILIAKTAYMHQLLDRLLREKQIKRVYTALVEEPLTPKTGTIQIGISKDPKHPTRRVAKPRGDEAITHYRVIQQNEDAAWVQLELDTGRTHQIRVHLSYVGAPLAGDRLYGGHTYWIRRQALHASEIHFTHPLTGERLSFQANLPVDLVEAGRLAGIPFE